MIETKKTEIKEVTFYIKPFTGFQAVKLDKQVIQLIAPALKGLEGFDKGKVDMGMIGKAISEALGTLDESGYEIFLKKMLSETLVEIENMTEPQSLWAFFDTVFQGNIMALYQLLYEIMEHNRFSFFELVGGGSGIPGMLSSKVGTGIKKKFGKK